MVYETVWFKKSETIDHPDRIHVYRWNTGKVISLHTAQKAKALTVCLEMVYMLWFQKDNHMRWWWTNTFSTSQE